MEEFHNPYTILFKKLESLEKSNEKIESKVDLILERLGEVDLHEEFNLKGQKAAVGVLNKCVSTLRKKIKEGKLQENYHYQKNDVGEYSFSEAALKSDKGLI